MRVVAVCSFVLCFGLAGLGRGEDSPPAAASVDAKPTGEDALLTQKIAELERLQAEVQQLRHAAGRDQQIRIDLKIVEISLTKMREAGLDITQLGVDPSDLDRSAASAGSADSKQTGIVGCRLANREGTAGLIAMLRREKIAKVLAEPSLVTVDRVPASFFSGGEYPVPITHANGSKGFTGRRIGTQVELTAKLLGAGRIHLDIHANASEVDPATSLTIAGKKVPGFRTREMDSPVEMELGKTAILGGLVQENSQTVVDRLTRRKSTVQEYTQLLFLVTPELFAAAAE